MHNARNRIVVVPTLSLIALSPTTQANDVPDFRRGDGCTDASLFPVIHNPSVYNLFGSNQDWTPSDWPWTGTHPFSIQRINDYVDKLNDYFQAGSAQYGVFNESLRGSHKSSKWCSPEQHTPATRNIPDTTQWAMCMVGFPFLGFPSFTGVPQPTDDSIYSAFLPPNVHHTGADCDNTGFAYHNVGAVPQWKLLWHFLPGLFGSFFPIAVVPLECAQKPRPCNEDSNCIDIAYDGTTSFGHCIMNQCSSPKIDEKLIEIDISHESIEASTNPWPTEKPMGTCWWDHSFGEMEGAEAADMCKPKRSPLLPGSSSGSYFNGRWVAPYWSNEAHSCVPTSSPVRYTFAAKGLGYAASKPNAYTMILDGAPVQLVPREPIDLGAPIFEASVVWNVGSLHSYSFVSPLSDPITPGVQYTTNTSGTLSVAAGPTQEVIANYSPEYYLSFYHMICSATLLPDQGGCSMPPVNDPELDSIALSSVWWAETDSYRFYSAPYFPLVIDPNRLRFDRWLKLTGSAGTGYGYLTLGTSNDMVIPVHGTAVLAATYVRQHKYHFASTIDGASNTGNPFHLKVWIDDYLSPVIDDTGTSFEIYVDEGKSVNFIFDDIVITNGTKYPLASVSRSSGFQSSNAGDVIADYSTAVDPLTLRVLGIPAGGKVRIQNTSPGTPVDFGCLGNDGTLSGVLPHDSSLRLQWAPYHAPTGEASYLWYVSPTPPAQLTSELHLTGIYDSMENLLSTFSSAGYIDPLPSSDLSSVWSSTITPSLDTTSGMPDYLNALSAIQHWIMAEESEITNESAKALFEYFALQTYRYALCQIPTNPNYASLMDYYLIHEEALGFSDATADCIMQCQ